MSRILLFFIAASVSFLFACSSATDKPVDPAYRLQIDTWHRDRVARLTRPDGWLSLAGRFWLQEGENPFGSGAENMVRFPPGSCPERMGVFILEKGVVSVRILPEVRVLTSDSSRVTAMLLQDDAGKAPTMLSYGSLSWHLIKRGDRYAIRLRDRDNARLRNFKGIERYPVDPAWRLPARFLPYVPVKQLKIVNVVGQVEEQPCPGALLFTVGGQEYRLDVLDEGAKEPFFIVMADATSGEETYGGGRFLYVERPDASGMTVLDFNQAYNPPCSFTPYATCPLPPPQNRLPIAIRAGEKRYEEEAGH